jgi:hypothetical protein
MRGITLVMVPNYWYYGGATHDGCGDVTMLLGVAMLQCR